MKGLIWGVGMLLAGILAWQVVSAAFVAPVLDEERPAIAVQQTAGDLTVTLRIVSAESGPNVLLAAIDGPDGRPAGAVTAVTLFPEMPGHDMAIALRAVPMERTGDGRFRAETPALDMFGVWNLSLAVVRPAGETTVSFQAQLAPTRPQVVLFAGLPLLALAVAMAGVLLLWRRGAFAAAPGSPQETPAP